MSPLTKSASKDALKKNIKTEMDANPGKSNRAQNLAIAYSVAKQAKKKAKKMADGGDTDGETLGKKIGYPGYAKGGNVFGNKDEENAMNNRMAEGGEVKQDDDSANDEKRPMPDNTYRNSDQVSRNRGNKPLMQSGWTDNPTIKDAQSPSPMAMSKPSRELDEDPEMHDEEDDLQSSASPSSPETQPKQRLNEMDASKSGDDVSDMSSQHNNGKAPYKKKIEDQYSEDESEPSMWAEGGQVDGELSISDSIMNKAKKKKMAKGGMASGSEDEDSAVGDMESNLSSSGRYGGMSEDDNLEEPTGLEEDDDQRAPSKDEYMSDRMPAFADGGEVLDDENRNLSISDAIVKRRREQTNPPQDGMASLEDNSEELPNQYYELDGKSAHEMQYDDRQISPQPEDSNEHDRILDDADKYNQSLIGSIRQKLKAKRGF